MASDSGGRARCSDPCGLAHVAFQQFNRPMETSQEKAEGHRGLSIGDGFALGFGMVFGGAIAMLMIIMVLACIALALGHDMGEFLPW